MSIVKRANTFHPRRRVPRRFAEKDDRTFMEITLHTADHTADRTEAERLAAAE